MKGRAALAAAVLAAVLSGCRAPAGGGAAAPPAFRPGDTWVLRTIEPSPWGPRERRERWVVEAIRDGYAEFRVEGSRGRVTTEWRPLPPADPPSPVTADGRRERVRVPAGSFRCERRVRSRTEPEGRVVQVDEWWAPGVPVPVQRWTRWNAHAAGPLRDPPRRAADQPLGTAWTVLERAPAR